MPIRLKIAPSPEAFEAKREFERRQREDAEAWALERRREREARDAEVTAFHREFLSDLTALSRKHGLAIDGCVRAAAGGAYRMDADGAIVWDDG